MTCDVSVLTNNRIYNGRCVDCGPGYVLKGYECEKHWPTCETYRSTTSMEDYNDCKTCPTNHVFASSNGFFDTNAASPTYQTFINGYGFCLPKPTQGTADCPPGYKEVGIAGQCKACPTYCQDCSFSGATMTTSVCNVCSQDNVFRYGQTTCYYRCATSSSTTLRYKNP